MSVFDGQIKTPRAVPDPFTDHMLPAAGALNYAAIASSTALQSTDGVVTSLVTGDHHEIFHGNEKRKITLDREHEVLGNQTSTVSKDRHDVVDENYNQHVTGTTQRFHIGATSEHFVEPHTNSHQSPRFLQEPLERLDVIGKFFEKSNELHQNFWYKHEMTGNKGEVCFGLSTAYKSVVVEMKATSLNIHALSEHEITPVHTEAKAMKADISALQSSVSALKTQAGASHVNVLAVFVTPFALGVYL